MIDRWRSDDSLELPPELAALDAELSAIKIEERASFGPELEAELRRAGTRPPPLPLMSLRRRVAIAACMAAALAGVMVPPARASLVALMERLQAALPSAAASPAPASAPVLAVVAAPEPVMRTASVVGRPEAADPFRPIRVVNPRVLDVEEFRNTVRRLYPPRLQENGIGGIVNVLVYIDSLGAAHQPQINESSGLPELDRAALQAASSVRFRPATQEGRPFGMWVRFDFVFEPLVDVMPRGVDGPDLLETSLEAPPEWLGYAAMPAPIMQETLELLRGALGDDAERLGSLEGVVHGEPPAESDPLEWRATAARALESAIIRAPDNPAPFLALARIRRKQGLPADARALLERGIRRAQTGGITVSPRLTAELNYEMAVASRDAWRQWAHLGRVPADALQGVRCDRAAVATAGDQVTPETLIAWNYLCPAELRRVLDARFEEVTGGDEREAMLRSLRAAVAADPSHVGANIELLLDLADRGDAGALLNGARRFGIAAGGHPYARLLSGIALHRQGHAEDAARELEAGLAGLGPEEEARIRDITPLLDPEKARRFETMTSAERARVESELWATRDPILSTDVNERMVAHLARSVYAHLRLDGNRTAAGDVWVRYGEPLHIRAVGEGTALRTELWDYGQGPAMTFRRPAQSTALDLTPEARAYLADLRTMLPHAASSRGRTAELLTAAVARFRSSSGALEADVVMRVPETLGAAGAPVEVALVQVGARGERVAIQRERATVGNVLRMRAEAVSGARELAVEVLNPALEHAATVRIPFDRAARGADARASDLQLTNAVARARRDVARGTRGIEPMPDAELVGAEVGALFELYDLQGQRPYQLHVELVPSAGGRPVQVEIRPAGETRFASSFVRTRWPEAGRVTEYVTIRLADVAPGAYTLRAVVDLGDGAIIVTERPIERR
jgi:TonB family protein